MTTLTEYIGAETLDQLASMFSSAAGATVEMLSPDGQVLARRGGLAGPGGRQGQPAAEERVLVAGDDIGTVVISGPLEVSGAASLAGLMRDVVVRLCEQAGQIRSRVEELAAMFRMTDVFAGRRDLKEINQLVAETMVKVTGADACSIRVFNEDQTELLRMAAYGLSDAYMSKGPILLSDSEIDRDVLASGQCVYIADERTDPRVLYKAEARREKIVSALCVPMRYRERIEGVIRVYTRRLHEFDWFETSLIRGVASQAASSVVNARLYHEAVEAEDIRRALRLAGVVQRRMIPDRPPDMEGLDISTVYVPCFDLAGDFYDFIELPDGKVGICVADVVGKGVRASLLMASVRSALRAHAAHIRELPQLLSAVNFDLWKDSELGDFVTLFYGVLDAAGRTLTYCSAGHEPALLIRDGKVRELTEGGGVIGLDDAMRFRQETVRLESADALIVCTDGFPEVVNFHDRAFGRRRLRHAALAAWRRGDSAEGIAKHLLWEIRRFAGLQTRHDDLTLVSIKVQ